MSRIATGNWDAVIVTHSGFERLPALGQNAGRISSTRSSGTWSAVIREKSDQDIANGSTSVKELERAKKRLEAKLKGLVAEHRKDDTLTFEELGVDRLVCR
jgi:N12 class adenine-specific DNA methylase